MLTVDESIEASDTPRFVLTISCADRPGLVFAVAEYIVAHAGNVIELQQFEDHLTGRFFMRVEFESTHEDAILRRDFESVAVDHAMTWNLKGATEPCRTLVMVSKFGHCLNDLLHRQSRGELNIEIPGIVSNHSDLAPLARHYDVPFHHIPVGRDNKSQAEHELLSLANELEVDLVVLARYMQVLSKDVCEAFAGRSINIHHSFLPSFKGAKPYHQAFERGVKLIGATAHYVTADLDEGPIIEQGVGRVTHRMSPEQMVEAGRDIEAHVLSRAIKWHADSRLIVDGSRVVVFE